MKSVLGGGPSFGEAWWVHGSFVLLCSTWSWLAELTQNGPDFSFFELPEGSEPEGPPPPIGFGTVEQSVVIR